MRKNIKKLISSNLNLLNDIYHNDGKLIILSVTQIIFSVIHPLLISIIPKIIMDSVICQVGIQKLIIRILIISVLIASISWINPSVREQIASKSEKIRIHYQTQLLNNLLTCNYELLNNRNNYEKAKEFVDGGGKAPAFEYSFAINDWATSLIGLVSCIYILSKNGISLLIVFFCSIIMEYFFNKNQFANKILMKERIYLLNIKSDYLFRKTLTSNFIRDAVIFGSTSEIIKKCSQTNKDIKNQLIQYNTNDSKIDLMKACFVLARDLIFCVIIIKNILNGSQSVSDFALSFGLINVMTKWVNTFYGSNSNLKYISTIYFDYKNFINLANDNYEQSYNIHPNKIRKVEFKNISYKYGDLFALRDINLVIYSHQQIAIVGKNGSGKSTLANIICGLYKPYTGQIFVNDIEVTYEEYAHLIQSTISVVFQKDNLLPEKLYSNISFDDIYNPDALYDALGKAQIIAKIKDLPNEVNTLLISSVNPSAPDFSGGETQRLLMSRCFYKNSEISLFDEPTASLDVIAESRIYKSIANQNCTSLIISHRIANITNSALIIVMDNGNVFEKGTHKDLLENKGIYYELYKIQENLSKN